MVNFVVRKKVRVRLWWSLCRYTKREVRQEKPLPISYCLVRLKQYSALGLSASAPICSLEKYSGQVSWHAAVSQQAIKAGYLQSLQNTNWIFARYLLHMTRSYGVEGKEESYLQDQRQHSSLGINLYLSKLTFFPPVVGTGTHHLSCTGDLCKKYTLASFTSN